MSGQVTPELKITVFAGVNVIIMNILNSFVKYAPGLIQFTQLVIGVLTVIYLIRKIKNQKHESN